MQNREQAGRFLSRINSRSIKNKGRKSLYQYGVGFLIGLFVVTLSLIPVLYGKNDLDVSQSFFNGDDFSTVSMGDPPSSWDWTIEDDTIFINNSMVYLSATPHTLVDDGWVEFELESKQLSGSIDVGFGFNSTTAQPKRIEIWRNYTHNLTGHRWVEQYMNRTLWVTAGEDLGMENYGSYDVDVGNENNTYLWNISYNSYEFMDDEWYNSSLIIAFESKTPPGMIPDTNYTFCYYDEAWETYHYDSTFWDWKPFNFDYTVVDYSFRDADIWYLFRDIPIQEDVRYKIRAWIDIPFGGLTGSSGKYWWVMKPHGKTIDQSIADGHFLYLDPWWNSDWSYYKTIEVDDKIDDYQMKILIDYGLDHGGNVSCDYHCQDDFDDIRFVYDNSTELPYWIESVTVITGAVFWVNNSGNYSSFEMFYGNDAVGNNSDGDTTFDFFDDFSYADSPDNHGWTNQGSSGNPTYGTENGRLKLDADGGNNERIELGCDGVYSDFAVDVDFMNANYYATDWYHGLSIGCRRDVDYYQVTYGMPPDNYGKLRYSNDWSVKYTFSNTVAEDVWYDNTIIMNNTYHETFVDDVSWGSSNACTELTSGYVHLSAYESLTYCDDFRIRKYTSPDTPSWSSFGSEQSVPTERIVSTAINGSYQTHIDERIVSTTINGSYNTILPSRIIDQTINGSYVVEPIIIKILDQNINGSFVTEAISEKIVSQTVNGSYQISPIVVKILDQTINGSYQTLVHERIVSTAINGSYTTLNVEQIISQTINGSYQTPDLEPPIIISESITSGLTSGETATIRANVTDTSNIEAVWVIVNDTVGSTNYTMSQEGATDFYNASFEVGENGTGTWYYKVFASDIHGNINNTASWHSFIVSKPDATPTNEVYPTSATPLTLIRITADLEATDLLKSVNATLNISSVFSFSDTDTYPQNQSIGNFSASETKTAEWHVFTPLLEDIYTFNISWNDNYSNFWNSSDMNIEVSYDITNLSNSTFVNVICAVEIEAGDDFTAEIQIRDGLGNYVNADSLPEISLIDPLGDVSVGPTTGGVANIETGRYSYTKSTAAGWMGGSWQMLADVTRNGYSFTDREFFKITSGPFDVRDISIIDNVVPVLSISVVLENQGGAITDIYVVWELTRTDTDALLDSGSDTVAVAGNSALTHTVSPSTSYVGEVKITFVGWYGSDFTERAGAFETFTTVSEEEPAPAPPGAPGGPSGPGLPSLYSLTVICEDGGRIYGVLLKIVEDGAGILSEYTDMDGEAFFEIPKHATITIQASKTGYEKAEETITVHSDMTMTIYMQPIGIPFMFWILLIPILAVASHVVYKKYSRKK